VIPAIRGREQRFRSSSNLFTGWVSGEHLRVFPSGTLPDVVSERI